MSTLRQGGESEMFVFVCMYVCVCVNLFFNLCVCVSMGVSVCQSYR